MGTIAFGGPVSIFNLPDGTPYRMSNEFEPATSATRCSAIEVIGEMVRLSQCSLPQVLHSELAFGRRIRQLVSS